MNRRCLLRCGWLPSMALLVILLVPGCGDDDSVTPGPSPSPKISMALECSGGLIELAVQNTGASMSAPGTFIAAFTDGQSDTLLLSLDAGDSTTCQLSNIHGGVTVSNEEWHLEATADDCLADYFESIGKSVVLNDLIPSPLARVTILFCTYTVYLSNFDYDTMTSQLIRTDDGLTLRYVYSNITGDVSAPSPGALCADLNGDITISSVVVESRVDIGEGDDPQVTLGEIEATVNGLHLNIDGTFGPIIGWITNFILDSFVGDLEVAVGSAIENVVGTDLSSLVIVRSSCAQ